MKKVILFGWALMLSNLIFANSNNLFSSPILTETLSNMNNDSAGIVFSDCPIIKKRCSGKKQWADGTTYEGAFRFGHPHGKGMITYADGGMYEGEFEKGYPHGRGMCTYPDGSRYEGDWYMGFKDGEGVYTFPKGHEYVGEFANDQIDGKGVILFTTGEAYNGDWKNGLADGEGVFIRKDGSQYIGKSKAGKRHEEGMIVWETGDTLKGNWYDGKLTEEANFIFSDGSSLLSYWEDGELQDGNITYITSKGQELWGTAETLVKDINQLNNSMLASTENNLQLAFYGFAMEYNATGDNKEAEKNLAIAFQFIEPTDNSPTNIMIAAMYNKLKNIKPDEALADANTLFRF